MKFTVLWALWTVLFEWKWIGKRKNERERKKEAKRKKCRISQVSSSLSEQMYARRKWKSDFKMICVLCSVHLMHIHVYTLTHTEREKEWMRYSVSLFLLVIQWQWHHNQPAKCKPPSVRKTFFFFSSSSSLRCPFICHNESNFSNGLSEKSPHTQANRKTASWSRETPFFHSQPLCSLSSDSFHFHCPSSPHS